MCAACHSVEQLHFRNLVDVAYTEDEGKAMAADIEACSLAASHCSQLVQKPMTNNESY